jgi:hypothetical protein
MSASVGSVAVASDRRGAAALEAFEAMPAEERLSRRAGRKSRWRSIASSFGHLILQKRESYINSAKDIHNVANAFDALL